MTNLEKTMRRHGVTEADLRRRLGISARTAKYSIDNGIKRKSKAQAMRYAEAIGCGWEDVCEVVEFEKGDACDPVALRALLRVLTDPSLFRSVVSIGVRREGVFKCV